MTFLNGIVDPSYAALDDILMENDSKTYADCILALRKEAVDIEENKKGHCQGRRFAANLRNESQEQDLQAQQDVRYLPQELWQSLSSKQKKLYKSHICQVKITKGPLTLAGSHRYYHHSTRQLVV